LGLINRVTPDGEALTVALELAASITANGQIAREAADWTLEEGWQRQAELYEAVFASQDAQEGARARPRSGWVDSPLICRDQQEAIRSVGQPPDRVLDSV
jgi:hypothetical protein